MHDLLVTLCGLFYWDMIVFMVFLYYVRTKMNRMYNTLSLIVDSFLCVFVVTFPYIFCTLFLQFWFTGGWIVFFLFYLCGDAFWFLFSLLFYLVTLRYTRPVWQTLLRWFWFCLGKAFIWVFAEFLTAGFNFYFSVSDSLRGFFGGN